MKKLSIFTQTEYSFEGKRPEEKVRIFVYSHWIILAFRFVYYAFLAFIPLLPMMFFAREIVQHELINLTLIALACYYLLLWSMFFYEVMIYLLDTWIVTDERILDIVQETFFMRTVAELNLSRIQDISVNTRGIIPTVLDYGDIEIQSAGAVNKFIFRQVPRPYLIKDQIAELVNETKKNLD